MKRQRGLTLIELLVAMILLAILSVLGYRAFGNLLIARERLMETGTRWVELARAFRRLEGELAELPPLSQVSNGVPPLMLQLDGPRQQLVLTRFSVRYQGGREALHYRADGQGLAWAAGAPELAANFLPLLPADSPVHFRVMTASGNWLDSWPVPGESARALEMAVTPPGSEPIRRQWALP
jgi:general secretion pathway protein J